MNRFEEVIYTISSDYGCAIMNDDYSGLNDEDEKLIADFLKTLPNGSFSPTDYDAETDFKQCEICGLYADCIDFTLLIELND